MSEGRLAQHSAVEELPLCWGRLRYIIHYMALSLDQPSVNELEDTPDC